MIRSILLGLAIALVASVLAWFIIPASTYVEDALGIIMLVFAVSAVIAVIMHRVAVSRAKNLTNHSTGPRA